MERWRRATRTGGAAPLRDYVFEAVADAIEWDVIGLDRGTFARTSGGHYFAPRKVSFRNQETVGRGRDQ